MALAPVITIADAVVEAETNTVSPPSMLASQIGGTSHVLANVTVQEVATTDPIKIRPTVSFPEIKAGEVPQDEMLGDSPP